MVYKSEFLTPLSSPVMHRSNLFSDVKIRNVFWRQNCIECSRPRCVLFGPLSGVCPLGMAMEHGRTPLLGHGWLVNHLRVQVFDLRRQKTVQRSSKAGTPHGGGKRGGGARGMLDAWSPPSREWPR